MTGQEGPSIGQGEFKYKKGNQPTHAARTPYVIDQMVTLAFLL